MLRLIPVPWFLLFLSLWVPPTLAQHPYYLESLAEARSSMTAGKWRDASEQLEMAAFGLMDQPALLAEIYVRWSLVAAQDENQALALEKAERARQYLGHPMAKPKELKSLEWTRFLTLVGKGPKPVAAELSAAKPSPSPDRVALKTETTKTKTPEKQAQAPPSDPVVGKPLKTEPSPPMRSVDPVKAKEAEVRKTADNLDLKYELIDLYLDRNRLGKARRLLKDVGKSQIGQIPYAERYARLFYLKKYYQTVIEAFQNMPAISEKTRYYLGLSFLETGDPEKAQEVLRSIDRSNFPDLSGVDHRINQLLSKKDAAVPSVEPVPATVAFPTDVETAIERLSVLVKNGGWDEVRVLVPKSRLAWPDNQHILYYLGRLHLANDASKPGSKVFYKLASNGYREREVFFYGGRAYFLHADYALAEYMFKRAEAEGTRFGRDIEAMRVVYRKRKTVAHN